MMTETLPAADRYEHRPRPFSNPLTLTLKGTELVAERGARTLAYALADVESLRLSFKPANTARLGFLCTLTMRDKRSLVFSNLDWRSMVENARQDPEYTAFVQALVAGIARSNPKAALLAGVPGWRRHLFMAGMAVLLPALLAGALYFLRHGSWPLGALTLGLALWLGLYARDFLTRNRPQTFRAGAIPPQVLPPQA